MSSKRIPVYVNEELYNFFKQLSVKEKKSLSSCIKDCLEMFCNATKKIEKNNEDVAQWRKELEERLYARIVAQRKK